MRRVAMLLFLAVGVFAHGPACAMAHGARRGISGQSPRPPSRNAHGTLRTVLLPLRGRRATAKSTGPA